MWSNSNVANSDHHCLVIGEVAQAHDGSLGLAHAFVDAIAAAGADVIHVDVMDGRFVPNISIGLPVVESLKKIAQKPLDCHLMIVEPEKFVEAFVKAGASNVSIQAEATVHLHRAIYQIKNAGTTAGVVLNPGSPLSLIELVLPDVDLAGSADIELDQLGGDLQSTREMIRDAGLEG